MQTKTLATIADPDGIKTSIASSTSAASYSGGALNGALAAADLDVGMTVSVTTSAVAGAYVAGSAVTFTGTDEAGREIQEVLQLTQANGGETIGGALAFVRVSSISVAAQADTDGALTFGYRDLLSLVHPSRIRGVRAGAEGNAVITYRGGVTDTAPLELAERIEHQIERVTSTGTTALPLTVLLA